MHAGLANVAAGGIIQSGGLRVENPLYIRAT